MKAGLHRRFAEIPAHPSFGPTLLATDWDEDDTMTPPHVQIGEEKTMERERDATTGDKAIIVMAGSRETREAVEGLQDKGRIRRIRGVKGYREGRRWIEEIQKGSVEAAVLQPKICSWYGKEGRQAFRSREEPWGKVAIPGWQKESVGEENDEIRTAPLITAAEVRHKAPVLVMLPDNEGWDDENATPCRLPDMQALKEYGASKTRFSLGAFGAQKWWRLARGGLDADRTDGQGSSDEGEETRR